MSHSMKVQAENADIARRRDAEARADMWQRVGPLALDLLRGERDVARGDALLWKVVALCGWGVVVVMALT